jgi:5-oxoprolinase (ATP-hydrolysing)
MQGKATKVLRDQGFSEDKIQAERYMNMRFDGTDTSIMVLDPSDGTQDFEGVFKNQYKEEFGLLLDRPIIVDDLKVRGLGKTFDTLGKTVYEEMKSLQRKDVDESKQSCTHSVYFDEIGRVDVTPVYELPSLDVGDVVKGPAMIIDDTQTIVVVPKSEVVVTSRHLFIQLH